MLQKVRDQNAKGDKIPETLATNLSQATLAYHRIIDAPADVLAKKGHDELAAAKDLLENHHYWKGGNLYLSGLADKALSAVPMIGPALNSIAERAEGGDVSGAATDVGAMVALENAPKIVKAGGKAISKAAEGISDVAGNAAQKINQLEVRPEQFRMPKEPAKPVTPHVTTDVPLDDATIRKSVDKNLSQEARETLRQHVGDTVPAGSSVENTLMKAVKPVNETITTQGLRLNKVLQDAPHFDTTPAQEVNSALNKLKNNLPGGTEDTFGKAIDKEAARARDVMQSSDPLEINSYIRELDKRIDSYSAPNEPIDSPTNAADAARVTIRRVLRDKLNTEIPATKPINDVLGKNLELRNALRKKFGDVAHDPVAADQQHLSELRKGQDYLDYEAQKAKVMRNLSVLKKLGFGVLGGAGLAGGAGLTKELWDLL